MLPIFNQLVKCVLRCLDSVASGRVEGRVDGRIDGRVGINLDGVLVSTSWLFLWKCGRYCYGHDSVGGRGGRRGRGCSGLQNSSHLLSQYSVCYLYLTNWLNLLRGGCTLPAVAELMAVLEEVSASCSFRRRGCSCGSAGGTATVMIQLAVAVTVEGVVAQVTAYKPATSYQVSIQYVTNI